MPVTTSAASAASLIAHGDGVCVIDRATRAEHGAAETFDGVAEVTHHGAAPGAAPNTGQPIALIGGGELTNVGRQSPWLRNYAHGAHPGVRPLDHALDAGQIQITEERGAVFDPQGRHDDLAPLQARLLTYRARLDGGAEQDASVTVLGAAGLSTQRAVSVVALDGDGDPVAFRFDRPMRIGLTPDRIPFVVAEPLTRPAVTGVRFLGNDGNPVDVTLTGGRSRAVSWRGATLWVLVEPGRVPLGAPTPLALATAYGSKVAEPAWGREWRAPDGVHARLTVRPNFETLHLYLDAGPGEARVRFRPASGGRWFPAQNLGFDDPMLPGRNPAEFSRAYEGQSVSMATVIPGAHRGVILHVAAGETYQVEVAHGGAVYRQTVAARSYKPAKVSWPVGPRTATVSVERVGADVVVTEGWGPAKTAIHTFTAPGGYVELTDLRLSGATLYVNTHKVIVRDADILGPPGVCVRLGPLAHDLRIVRGRFRGWAQEAGDSGWGLKARACGCVLMNQSSIYDGAADLHYHGQSGGAFDVPSDRQQSNHAIAMIGMLIGPPRHPANSWEHTRPDGTSRHPYGSSVLYSSRGSFLGRNAILDCSVDIPRWKAVDELLSGDNDGTTRGPCGPDFLLAHTFLSGSTDDALELDGPSANCAVVGFHVEARQIASESTSPRAVVSAAPIYWGPVVLARCVSVYAREPWMYVVPAGSPPFGWPQTRFLKLPRRQDGLTTDNGWIFVWHCTVRGEDGDFSQSDRREHAHFWQTSTGERFTAVANTLHRQRNDWTDPSPGADVAWGANDFARQIFPGADQTRQLGYIGGSAVLANPVLALPATRAANVNDGGPWAAANADLRCGAGV